MITIKGVTPTARELRPITRGWGGMHWWCMAPTLLPFLGLWAVIMTIAVMAPWYDELCEAVAIISVATAVIWFAVRLLVNRLTLRAARSAPAAGLLSDWRFDETGVSFQTPVATSQVDWAGIKAVREERDRFILLLTPQNNPVLPKRHLSDAQMEALRALIAEVTASGRLGRGVD